MVRGFILGAIALLSVCASQAIAADTISVTIKLQTNDITVKPDASSVQRVHAELYAENDAGAMRLNQIHLGFDQARQELRIDEAYTLKPNGTKYPIDMNAVFVRMPQADKDDDSSMITDKRVKVLVFPQLAAGDTAVYTVTYIDKGAVFPGVYTYGQAFARSVPVKMERDSITAPKSMNMRTESHDVQFTIEDQGDNMVYRWQYSADKPSPEKEVAVSPLDQLPRYFISNVADYAALGKAYGLLTNPKVIVTPKVAELAQKLTAGIRDKHEQTRALYEWVNSNIRYVGIELGDSTMVPHDVDAILTYGYGDCKDHDLIMRSLLKAKGITTQSILINATNAYTLTAVPTFFQLDHVITYVPDQKLFLDSSALATPFGVLPFAEYGKPAIYVGADNATLGTMPVLQPNVAAETTKIEMKLSAAGVLTGKTSVTGVGPSQIMLRYVGLALQAGNPEKLAAQQLTDRGYNGATGTLRALQPLVRGPSYTVNGDFTIPGWGEWLTGNKVSFMPIGLRVLGVAGDGPMGTMASLQSGVLEPTPCFSVHQVEDVSMEIPVGTKFASVPKDFDLKTENIEFSAKWTVTGNTVSVHRDFRSTITQPLCVGNMRLQAAKALIQIANSYVLPIHIVPNNAGPQLLSENVVRPVLGPKPFGNLTGTAPDNVTAVAKLEQSERAAKLAGTLLASNRSETPDSDYANHLAKGLDGTRVPEAVASLTNALRNKTDVAAAVPGAQPNKTPAVYAKVDKNKLALADLDKAMRVAPNDVSLREMHANLRIAMKDWDGAAEDYNMIAKAKPNDPAVLLKRAEIRYHADKFDEAAIDYRRSLRLGVAENTVRSGLCHSLARAEEMYQQAIDHCSKELAQNAAAVEVLESRGLAYFRMGKYADALRDFSDAAKAKPDDPRYRFERGVAMVKLGDDAGRKDIAAATEIMPKVARKVPSAIGLAVK